MTALIRYEEACRAISEARAIDEVKEILDKSDAVRMYARQAGNRMLEIEAVEIRLRAKRRMGDLILVMKDEGLIRTGPASKDISDSGEQIPSRVTLEELGVDRRLSMESQQASSRSISQRAFDAMIDGMRSEAQKGKGIILDPIRVAAKEARDSQRKEAHAALTYEGGKVEHLHDLIATGYRAKAILMDPPWHFMTRSEKGEGRSAGVHYTTETADLIANLPVAQLADENCVLFMWMVDWCPQWALDLIEGWGFTHKTTAFTWVKQLAAGGPDFHMGQGYWTRANPEPCWLATKGKPKRIHADVRQLIVAPVMEHSRKPDIVHDRIERLVDGPYLELYARRERSGWKTWGNEIPFKLDSGERVDPNTGEILDDSPAEHIVDADKVIAADPPNFDEMEIPAFLRRRPATSEASA